MARTTMTKYFFFQRTDHHRDLHSFPTRRSSDLVLVVVLVGAAHRVVDRVQPILQRRVVHRGHADRGGEERREVVAVDRKSTRLNSSHSQISYAVFCLKKKTKTGLICIDLLQDHQ